MSLSMNISKKFENQKILDCFTKFCVNGPCLIQNLQISWYLYEFIKLSKNISKIIIFNTRISCH